MRAIETNENKINNHAYFYSICEEDDFEQTDRNCWTGSAVGQYTQTVMGTGHDTQRYNPEVPLDESNERSTRLNELADKLVKLRSSIEVSGRLMRCDCTTFKLLYANRILQHGNVKLIRWGAQRQTATADRQHIQSQLTRNSRSPSSHDSKNRPVRRPPTRRTCRTTSTTTTG